LVQKVLEINRDVCDYTYMDSLFLKEYIAMDTAEIPCGDTVPVVRVKNAVLLPVISHNGENLGGVLREDGEYEPASGFRALSEVDRWGGAYAYEKAEENTEETVIYMGRFWKHWGHFLLDMVSRLWYIVETKEEWPIVYDAQEDISGVYLELMQLFGIRPERLVRVSVPTRFREIIIPGCSMEPGIFYSGRFKRLFDLAVKNAQADNPFCGSYAGRKVYFTRTQLNRGIPMETGEKEIEEFFRQNGFLIIAPEKHPLKEQITMLQEAAEIACVSGTLPHNMVFARDGMPLTIIRKTNKPNYRQVTVNRMRQLRVTNVDAHISPRAVGPSGPFILDVNDNVKRYASARGMTVPENRFPAGLNRIRKLAWYLPVYLARNHGKNRSVPRYINGEFVNDKDAEKELAAFYLKRMK